MVCEVGVAEIVKSGVDKAAALVTGGAMRKDMARARVRKRSVIVVLIRVSNINVLLLCSLSLRMEESVLFPLHERYKNVHRV
jgi:hypothetical protein